MLKTKWWLWFRIITIGIASVLSIMGRLGDQWNLLVIGPSFGLFLYMVLFLSALRERFQQKQAAPACNEENSLQEPLLRILDWLVAIGFLLKLLRSITWIRMAQQVWLFL